MKVFISFFIMIMLASISHASDIQDASVQKSNISKAQKCIKTYVQPEQILLQQSALWVNMGNLWLQPESIHRDAGGLYFESLYRDSGIPDYWQCRVCLYWNVDYNTACEKCHNPRGTRR